MFSLSPGPSSPRPDDRADLHLHTTCSDGTYSPAQIVDLARRSGLAAIAITDHDTVAGVALAQQVAGNVLEIVPALELTAVRKGVELHLLGYFIRPSDAALQSGLKQLQGQREERFLELARRLRACGLSVDEKALLARVAGRTPGRRHLAEWLVETKQVSCVQQAFDRYLSSRGRVTIPSVGLPVAEAIGLIRGAGGVAIWAHPAYDCRQKSLHELCELGLQGIEVEYPGYRRDRVKQLRELATRFGLVVSGGSDCHGPWPAHQIMGARSISIRELDFIRQASM